MLAALFIAAAAPLLVFALLRLLALRAIPICVAGGTLWAIGSGSGNWVIAALAALSIAIVVTYLLDQLRELAATRAGIVMIETLAGIGLATLFAFAVFYSTGTQGSALYIAMAASASIALVTSLRFNPR
ncbi:MAG: hypothetical protein WAU68_11790 [Vitreimonas sp.]